MESCRKALVSRFTLGNKKMKKKKLIQNLTMTFALAVSFSIGFTHSSKASISELDELVGCQSESMYSVGSDYYDCGDCKKIKDRVGIGNTRICQTSSQQQ